MADNELKKCPACGAIVTSFATVCPECGTELSVGANETAQSFSEKLEKIDTKIADNDKSGSEEGIGCLTVVLWLFFFPIMMIIYLIKLYGNTNQNLTGYEKQKSNLINTFPIPNSRNDLLEFAILVESQVESFSLMNALSKHAGQVQMWNKVWMKKMEQIVKKASMSMKDDTRSLDEIKSLQSAAAAKVKANQTNQFIMLGVAAVVFIGLIVVLALNQ